jgi:hypothetical protein
LAPGRRAGFWHEVAFRCNAKAQARGLAPVIR